MVGHAIVGEYTLAMRRRRYSQGTIYARQRVTRGWLEWIGPRWVSATWHDVDAYGDTRNVAPTTWRDEISHLSAFYRWAMKCELAANDPTMLVDRPRVGVRLPRPVTASQYARALDTSDLRMRAILELMAWCGLRCIEVSRLRWSDVDMVERVAIVHGKGNKERTVGLPRRVVQALAAIDASTTFVIVGDQGRQLDACRVSQMVGAHCRALRLPVSAHQFRHRFATVLLDAAGGDLLVVQQALGHTSVSSTQVYAQVDRKRALEVAKRLDGRDINQLFDTG